MAPTNRFLGLTVQFFVADIRAGIEFYSRLIGRPPDFEPHADFKEWEIFDNCWLQVGQGKPRPTYTMRLRVENIDAERERIERQVGARCSPVQRISGLVALCNFSDPWGNRLGLYQRLFVDGVPRVLGGSHADYETER
ncbi:MAG: VOC family protein [Acidobacteria bacterium]|nr:VOC family protein [Acidobacteriota bacterium]